MHSPLQTATQPEQRDLVRLANQAAANLDACRETIAATAAGTAAGSDMRLRRGMAALEPVGRACGLAARDLLDTIAQVNRSAADPRELASVLAMARSLKALLDTAERQSRQMLMQLRESQCRTHAQ